MLMAGPWVELVLGLNVDQSVENFGPLKTAMPMIFFPASTLVPHQVEAAIGRGNHSVAVLSLRAVWMDS